MRVAINPQFFRHWYDRTVQPVFYGVGVLYGSTGVEWYEDPYVVPEGYFALVLSINVYAMRMLTAGYISNVLLELDVALRERPTRYQPVWRTVLSPGVRGREAESVVGHLGFLRDGDRLRWYVNGYRDQGEVQVEGIVWLAQFLYQG